MQGEVEVLEIGAEGGRGVGGRCRGMYGCWR